MQQQQQQQHGTLGHISGMPRKWKQEIFPGSAALFCFVTLPHCSFLLTFKSATPPKPLPPPPSRQDKEVTTKVSLFPTFFSEENIYSCFSAVAPKNRGEGKRRLQSNGVRARQSEGRERWWERGREEEAAASCSDAHSSEKHC